MTIPFRVKRLTDTAKLPERANEGDLWDIFADGFCLQHLEDRNATLTCQVPPPMYNSIDSDRVDLRPMGRILIKTGIAIELPIKYRLLLPSKGQFNLNGTIEDWFFQGEKILIGQGINALKKGLISYAVADLRPRSGLALKHGITVLNSPATIDNSYRKEIGVIIYNAGREPYTINKGDKICQMLIRPLYLSSMEIVDNIEDTNRGAYGSTGK